ncbi:MAG: hypothetical protein AB7O86_05760 [Porticoccaceae bacterium]
MSNYTPPSIDEIDAREEGIDSPATVTVPQGAQKDYFGFGGSYEHYLDDGVSYVELKVFNEGERSSFQNQTNRDVRIHKGGDASVKMVPGNERHALLKLAIVGWNLRTKGGPIACTPPNVDKFIKSSDPRVVDDIEKAIRTQNPWLLADVSIEDIDKEIETLTELRATKVAEEEGKASSADR